MLALACMLMVGAPAHAQAGAVAQPNTIRACLDAIPGSALSPEVVYLVPDDHDVPGQVVRPLTLNSLDLLAQSIAERMRPTADSAKAPAVADTAPVSWRELSGRAIVTVRRDGSFSVRAKQDTSDHGFATSYRGLARILRAAERVARDGETVLWDPEQEADSLTFALSLTTATHGRDGAVHKLESRIAFPVFVVRTPWSDKVTQVPNTGRIRYPDEPRRRGYTAVVMARFTVDTAGRAIESSINDYFAPGQPRPTGDNLRMYDMFVREVRRAIPQMRFTSGTVAGCALPVTVRQPFTFDLRY